MVEEAVAYAEDLAASYSATSPAIIKGQVQRDQRVDFDAAFEESRLLLPGSVPP